MINNFISFSWHRCRLKDNGQETITVQKTKSNQILKPVKLLYCEATVNGVVSSLFLNTTCTVSPKIGMHEQYNKEASKIYAQLYYYDWCLCDFLVLKHINDGTHFIFICYLLMLTYFCIENVPQFQYCF